MIRKVPKIFVAMSGGVDSSVAAALLKRRGYDVTGVFIKVWNPSFLECTWRAERRDAMRVAARLGIPLLTFDFEREYKREVVDYMIREYRAGRTPNPDVMCNRAIKFGAFFRKASALGADYIATGHYARSVENAFSKVLGSPRFARPDISKKHFLLRGKDEAKDQSYFLWTLGQKELQHCLFPVGGMQKSQVRKLARKFDLPNAEKKDSQGLCFLGKLDVKDFLKHYIKEKTGKVFDENGKIIGKHPGAVFFTLGERHCFDVTKKTSHDKPYYITAKDIKKNILIVSQTPPFALPQGEGWGGVIKIKNTNWISGLPATYNLKPKTHTCQTRYHGERIPCRLSNVSIGKKTATVELLRPALAVPGQSLVLYDGSVLLGGGIID